MVALMKMPSQAVEKAAAERRVFPRKEIHITASGRRVDHTLPALKNPMLTLALRDLSLGGLSAISPAPLSQGERLNVTFPSTTTLRGWDANGRVIRCEPSAMGYRIAVEFDPLPAAA